jgi:hypothetical protein
MARRTRRCEPVFTDRVNANSSIKGNLFFAGVLVFAGLAHCEQRNQFVTRCCYLDAIQFQVNVFCVLSVDNDIKFSGVL